MVLDRLPWRKLDLPEPFLPRIKLQPGLSCMFELIISFSYDRKASMATLFMCIFAVCLVFFSLILQVDLISD